MFKTKLIISILEVIKWFSNIFAGLGVLGSFTLLIKTDSLLNEQGRQAIYLNELFYRILFISLLPSFVYVLLDYIVKWTMKDNFNIIQKSVFKDIPTQSYFLAITHYIIIIFTFIGVCIAHTHYIWLISIPVLLFIFMIDFVVLMLLCALED